MLRSRVQGSGRGTPVALRVRSYIVTERAPWLQRKDVQLQMNNFFCMVQEAQTVIVLLYFVTFVFNICLLSDIAIRDLLVWTRLIKETSLRDCRMMGRYVLTHYVMFLFFVVFTVSYDAKWEIKHQKEICMMHGHYFIV